MVNATSDTSLYPYGVPRIDIEILSSEPENITMLIGNADDIDYNGTGVNYSAGTTVTLDDDTAFNTYVDEYCTEDW